MFNKYLLNTYYVQALSPLLDMGINKSIIIQALLKLSGEDCYSDYFHVKAMELWEGKKKRVTEAGDRRMPVCGGNI